MGENCMYDEITRLLNSQNQGKKSHIFPFLWMHGETESVLREYMEAIYQANLRAVCVESRPHPDFCGPRWWKDMEIILDEARSRGMRVYILDDSHFPTGYANGALIHQSDDLHRQFIVRTLLGTVSEGESWTASREQCTQIPPWEPQGYELGMETPHQFSDDALLGVVAIRLDKEEQQEVEGSACFSFCPQEGIWRLYSLVLTRNRGPHRDYINMLSHDSCKVLLEAVYEPHWQHFSSDFGTTIAGFFSDEPELGNGHLYESGKRLWELDDLPWSRELEEELQKRWKGRFLQNCVLLWEKGSGRKVRVEYMDNITKLVAKNFSLQIGTWCRNHGVEYIGHLIEDNDQHQRTGSSLGHYFRGLDGQSMAGIDDIGGQVLPQGEWNGPWGTFQQFRNGLFYHYVLGKLGASLAAIDPLKHGRCLCEIFGNYGWEEGVRLEKYLVDHFLVRGVNFFVPHAFSPMEYPDPDCPPHFYAHGHNPQYRHFGALMAYTERICRLFDEGKPLVSVALLYTAEADWAGDTLQLQSIAQPLYDRQIDFHILPSDVLSDIERYKTHLYHGLQVNGNRYKVLIIPQGEWIPSVVKKNYTALQQAGVTIVVAGTKPSISAPVVLPEKLPQYLDQLGVTKVILSPANSRIRCYLYQKDISLCMMTNEGTRTYRGTVKLPIEGPCFAYDPWVNTCQQVSCSPNGNESQISIELEPLHSIVFLFGLHKQMEITDSLQHTETVSWDDGWRRSICTSIQYPIFREEKSICLPDTLATEKPDFSGFVRYEKVLNQLDDMEKVMLLISDAYEGVEVFVNDQSLGIQIVPTFSYNLTEFLSPGENLVRIEVATTLERENAHLPDPIREYLHLGSKVCTCPSGINGHVFLQISKKSGCRQEEGHNP